MDLAFLKQKCMIVNIIGPNNAIDVARRVLPKTFQSDIATSCVSSLLGGSVGSAQEELHIKELANGGHGFGKQQKAIYDGDGGVPRVVFQQAADVLFPVVDVGRGDTMGSD